MKPDDSSQEIDREPDRYFLLEIRSASYDRSLIPEKVLSNLGKVKKGSDWEAIGLIPYNIRSRDIDKETYGFGSVCLNGQYFTFQPYDEYDDDQKDFPAVIKTGDRIVATPGDVYALRKLGISYDEISNAPSHFKEFTEARLAMEIGDYQAATSFAQEAIRDAQADVRVDWNWAVVRYQKMLDDVRIKLSDVSAIEEQIKYYRNDMESAVHTGLAQDWIKVAVNAKKDYCLGFDIALRVLNRIDAQIAHPTQGIYSRSFGAQEKKWSRHKRQQFVKRLGSLRGFLSKDLVSHNLDRPEALAGLLREIEKAAPNKVKKISDLLALLGK